MSRKGHGVLPQVIARLEGLLRTTLIFGHGLAVKLDRTRAGDQARILGPKDYLHLNCTRSDPIDADLRQFSIFPRPRYRINETEFRKLF
jgi:hypothetical protein